MLSDNFFLGGVFLVVFLGDHIQLLGAPGYALLILIFAVAGWSEIFTKDKVPIFGLTIWGLVYVFLSYNRILPSAWTSHFDSGTILQQASYLAGLLPIIAASQRFWRRVITSAKRSTTACTVVLIAFLLGCIVDLLLMKGGFLLRVRGTLKNDTALILFVISMLVIVRNNAPAHGLLLGSTFYVGIVRAYMQTLGVHAYVWATRLLQRLLPVSPRVLLFSFVLSTLVLTVVGFRYVQDVWDADPNTGWRLAFWRDSMAAVWQTRGVGVGFGTEAIRNFYPELMRDLFRSDANDDFLLIGTHNAFSDVGFRLGVVGLFLFLIIVYQSIPSREIKFGRAWHASFIFVMIFTCLYLNVALQSPTYSIGVGVLLGYLRAVNQVFGTAKAKTHLDRSYRRPTPIHSPT